MAGYGSHTDEGNPDHRTVENTGFDRASDTSHGPFHALSTACYGHALLTRASGFLTWGRPFGQVRGGKPQVPVHIVWTRLWMKWLI